MIVNLVKRRFKWPTQLVVNGVIATMIATMIVTATMSHLKTRNPNICFVKNAHAGVLCAKSADAPIASKLYVAIAESGCVRIVGTGMIYAGAMVIVLVAAPKSIAVLMDGLVVNVTSGCVLGAAGATIHVRNAAPERNWMMTMTIKHSL
jgi:hypothetical protein